MAEIIQAANTLTWPGAFAIIGLALAAVATVWIIWKYS